MHGYHPRGISFDKLEQACQIGAKYYELVYWTNLVVDDNNKRRVEFLDKDAAITAYRKIKAEGDDREYSLKEFEFKGNSWSEHVKNSMFDEGVHVVEAYEIQKKEIY